MKNKHFSFFLITLSLFIALVLPKLMSEGMFLDGLTYSAIARNLAEGSGTFWSPHCSKVVYNQFYEHPPLVFGIQSLLFKMFGDSIFVERGYSLLTGLVTISLIVAIWRKLNTKKSLRNFYWLPVFLWTVTPIVFWSYSNNMLENTMGVFTLSAVFMVISGYQANSARKLLICYFLAAVLILLGALSKGPVALFPLATPFLAWLSGKKNDFSRIIMANSFLILITVLLFFLLAMISPDANDGLLNYYNTQLINSLSGNRAVVERTFILKRLIEELLPMISVAIIILVLNRRHLPNLANSWLKPFLFLLFIGLSASIPIAISPKQMSYYLVPSMPFFALSFALLIAPFIERYFRSVIWNERFKLALRNGSVILLLLVTGLGISKTGTVGRDRELIHDVKLIGNFTGSGTHLTIPESLDLRWEVRAYFTRYFKIEMETAQLNRFYLLEKSQVYTGPVGAKPIDLPLQLFELYDTGKVNEQE